MIHYHNNGIRAFLRQILQLQGSVFPRSFLVALPCASVAAALKIFADKHGWLSVLDDTEGIVKNNAAWHGFSILVGFLVVFRTSQAYTRFWDGCGSTRKMRVEWFHACSSIVAFCRARSVPDRDRAWRFEHLLVRLFSLLHAVALADIEDKIEVDDGEAAAFSFELVDVEGIDPDSLLAIKESNSKVELLFQWIQQSIVEHVDAGVVRIPDPILSRVFHEIAEGLIAFEDAMKVSSTPFPFPYAQACNFLLIIHGVVVPFVFATWIDHYAWAFVFTLIQVFILWSLNFIAMEIENPFGMDDNDLDGRHMQLEMNQHLILLLNRKTMRTPSLSADAILNHGLMMHELCSASSLAHVWTEVEANRSKDNKSPQRVVRRFVSNCNSVKSQGRGKRAQLEVVAAKSGNSGKSNSVPEFDMSTNTSVSAVTNSSVGTYLTAMPVGLSEGTARYGVGEVADSNSKPIFALNNGDGLNDLVTLIRSQNVLLRRLETLHSVASRSNETDLSTLFESESSQFMGSSDAFPAQPPSPHRFVGLQVGKI